MKVKVSNSPMPSEFEEVDLTLATRKGGEYLIGRSPDSDLVLDSPDVSRLHAKFFSQGGNYYFSDLGSRNGSTINGKLAEKNQLYILKDQDIIRIGDFILMMEEIIPLDQGAETVVRIINPSVFSNRRTTQNASSSNVGEQTPEIVTPVAEEISQSEDKVEVSEAVYAEPISTPENVIQSKEIVSEVPSAIVGESESITDTPVTAEESTNDATSNTSDDLEYYTTVQPRDTSQQSQVESDDSEYYTTVQPRNISQQSQAESDDSEITFVQSRDIASESQAIALETDINPPQAIALETDINPPEAIALETDITSPEAIALETDITPPEAIALETDITPPEAIALETDITPPEAIALETDITPPEAIALENDITLQPEAIALETDTISQPEAALSTDTSSQPEAALSTDTSESEAIALSSDTSSQPEAIALSDDITSPEAIALSSDTSESEAIALSSDTSESEAIALETDLDQSDSEVPQIIPQKHIVLIAHETKKSELAEFVAQHKEFLSQCLTVTWSSVSEVLHQQAGITVSEQIPPATSGGYQRINSLVNSGDILAVIFIRDFLAPQPGQANEEALLRTCNINQVLLANNIPTAEAIVHYIQHTAR